MTNRTLYIFEPTFDVSQIIPNSILLSDYQQKLSNEQYHTSLGDLTDAEILSVAKQFDEVHFLPQGFDLNSSVYKETTILLTVLSHRLPVIGFWPLPLEKHLNFDVESQSSSPKLWVFGCSHSHGVGLLPGQKRYSDILSEQMNLPLVSITKPGSSTQWSLRHIVNANFSKDDTVIWQITTPNRLTWGDPKPAEVMLSRSKNRQLVDLWSKPQTYFYHLSLINTGVQYLRSQNVKFTMTSIENEASYHSSDFYSYITEYVKYPEYCYCSNWMQDFGSDNGHAGPLSHQTLAKHILDHVKYFND